VTGGIGEIPICDTVCLGPCPGCGGERVGRGEVPGSSKCRETSLGL